MARLRTRARCPCRRSPTRGLKLDSSVAIWASKYRYDPEVIIDVGVAGLHRLLAVVDDLQDADVTVVVAGMEGSLPSAIGGLTSSPVVAVPTSVGYGSSLDGHTALLGMLASCAQGITVMGIDNGFGAACAAIRVLARIAKGRTSAL